MEVTDSLNEEVMIDDIKNNLFQGSWVGKSGSNSDASTIPTSNYWKSNCPTFMSIWLPTLPF